MNAIAPSVHPGGPSAPAIDLDSWSQRIVIVVMVAAMGLFIAAPLAVIVVRSLTDDTGSFAGLGHFIFFLQDRALRQSSVNTLVLGIATMLCTVGLAFPFAYSVACTSMPLRRLFLVLCMLPIYAPTMLYGIGLYSLFGNQGLLTTGFFGRLSVHVGLPIHGLTGIVIAEVLAALPPVVLVLVVSLSHRDRRLYEAADAMGASRFRIFRAITLPTCRAGLISAAAIAFVLSTTDYGAPEMLAEKTDVLALDIAVKAMGLGQKSDPGMGAVISLVLLLPTAIATGIQLIMRRNQSAVVNSRSVPMLPAVRSVHDWFLFLVLPAFEWVSCAMILSRGCETHNFISRFLGFASRGSWSGLN